MYGTYEGEFRPIGGLNIRLAKRFTSLLQFDGHKLHPGLTYSFNDTHALTFLLVRMKQPGVTYTFSF